ncbi:hypothetical protein GCK72_018423 [Caenorhabditis remanei]|uniref:Uncharacterized protein n=1 Tax=Caenorhabditis remanei TaxID=31234 RepID=A0A6A5GBU3_CAERE|nr:hypothetical protein GCK72_018423 [Caenorhabditis remanei]KAF1751869.1 hypothetical protein GCK72_018423 [Caenorhabditis remanei]
MECEDMYCDVSDVSDKRTARRTYQTHLHHEKKGFIEKLTELLLPTKMRDAEVRAQLRSICDIFEKKFPDKIIQENGCLFRRTVEYGQVRKSVWATCNPDKNFELFQERIKQDGVKSEVVDLTGDWENCRIKSEPAEEEGEEVYMDSGMEFDIPLVNTLPHQNLVAHLPQPVYYPQPVPAINELSPVHLGFDIPSLNTFPQHNLVVHRPQPVYPPYAPNVFYPVHPHPQLGTDFEHFFAQNSNEPQFDQFSPLNSRNSGLNPEYNPVPSVPTEHTALNNPIRIDAPVDYHTFAPLNFQDASSNWVLMASPPGQPLPREELLTGFESPDIL